MGMHKHTEMKAIKKSYSISSKNGQLILTCWRWIDLVFLSFCVTVLFAIFNVQIGKGVQLFERYIMNEEPFWGFSSFVLLCSLFSYFLICCGAIPPVYSFKTHLKYPPVSIAAILAVPFCIWLLNSNECFDITNIPLKELIITSASIIALISSGVLIALIYYRASQNSIFCMAKAQTSEQLISKYPNLGQESFAFLEWLLNDEPILKPEQDLYDASISARRIANMLLERSSRSVGLIGAFGTGKSCILNLIEYYIGHRGELRNATPEKTIYDGEVICCRLDGWGRISGSISKKLLEISINRIRQRLDCLSIATLPEKYQTAIGATPHAIGGILAALLQHVADPLEQLKKLDNILITSNIRLVIFIEDLDRNSNQNAMDNELFSLLDRLSELNQVAFVIALSPEKNWSSVLPRICDYQEAVA